MLQPNSRIFLKISGEALSSQENAINHDIIRSLSHTIKKFTDAGHQVALMVGAGNIFRGRNE